MLLAATAPMVTVEEVCVAPALFSWNLSSDLLGAETEADAKAGAALAPEVSGASKAASFS